MTSTANTLAYLDTNSGIAGDMTLAALVDAGADADYIRQQIGSLGLADVELVFSETQRHCFRALMLDVRHPPEHAHRHLSDIEAMIGGSALTARESELALRLFRKIGVAEAKVHGTTLEEVHFHEVGAVDSIVDIVGIAVALSNLGIQRIIASPTPTGSGKIHIAHGLVSVPAPATAELLKGVPICSSRVEAELTTPTGAAVLATLVDGFGPLPDMQISAIGYGAGHKDFAEQANVLRILIGAPLAQTGDEVVLLETNLDDRTGEQIGFAIEQLWKAGALDVYTTAIGMKKNRPATMLSVIGRPESRGLLEDCLFQHTGSLGIRRTQLARRKQWREVLKIDTPLGEARVKVAWAWAADEGTNRAEPSVAPEYEDCRRLAQQHNRSLEQVFRIVLDASAEKIASLLPPAARTTTLGAPEAPATQIESTPQSHDHSHDHHHH